MRACNGCRKRKIKCDAATTNTWPCSACNRLKLVCVPPKIGQDGDFLPDGQSEPTTEAGGPSSSAEGSHAFPAPPVYRDTNTQHDMNTMPPYDPMNMYSQFLPHAQPAMYNDLRPPPISMPHSIYQHHQDHQPHQPAQPAQHNQHHQPHQPHMYTGTSQPSSMTGSDRKLCVDNDQSTAENLSDVLGELKIDETGIGMTTMCSHIQIPPADD